MGDQTLTKAVSRKEDSSLAVSSTDISVIVTGV
jgi:hypothetical protein